MLMDIFSIFTFLGGLGLFLFGMNVLSDAIGRQTGGKLKTVLERITSNKLSGILLGALVTAVIQSSGATTVMIIGFINSGIISLSNAVGPIMGANIGTTVTAWILALNDISGSSFILRLINPTSFVPVLAFIGAVLLVFSKKDRTKDIGVMILGFSVLMFGMRAMSDSMSPLKNSSGFQSVIIALSNPFLGLLAGFLIAAILQSSSASVGIIQAAAITGVVTIGNSLPLIMGINIGAGLIVLVSSAGTNCDAKRAAWVYVLHNTISALVFLIILCIVKYCFDGQILAFSINSFGIAILHTLYKMINTAIQLPFTNQIIRLVERIVPARKEEQRFMLLDDNFLRTPALAVARSYELVNDMAELTRTTIKTAIEQVLSIDESQASTVRMLEDEIDVFEDKIGAYLVKLSRCKLTEADSQTVSLMLHGINDLERMSDHAKNIVESGEELVSKDLHFSEDAVRDLSILFSAVCDVTDYSIDAFINRDSEKAYNVDPLEQVVDDLKEQLRDRHIERLKQGACSTTLGFVYTDILTDLERISDHCSNLALEVLQMNHPQFEPHSFEANIKHYDQHFAELYSKYSEKYRLV